MTADALPDAIKVLAAADLEQEPFLELIRTLQIPDDPAQVRIWAEAADGWTIDFFSIDPEQPVRWYAAHRDPRDEQLGKVLARASAGRVFARTGELKWRVLDGAVRRTVFIGENDWTSGALAKSDASSLATMRQTREVLLWGQRSSVSAECWIELRIPQRLQYPVPGAPGMVGVQAVVETWFDARGEPQFSRLVDLKEIEHA